MLSLLLMILIIVPSLCHPPPNLIKLIAVGIGYQIYVVEWYSARKMETSRPRSLKFTLRKWLLILIKKAFANHIFLQMRHRSGHKMKTVPDEASLFNLLGYRYLYYYVLVQFWQHFFDAYFSSLSRSDDTLPQRVHNSHIRLLNGTVLITISDSIIIIINTNIITIITILHIIV